MFPCMFEDSCTALLPFIDLPDLSIYLVAGSQIGQLLLIIPTKASLRVAFCDARRQKHT